MSAPASTGRESVDAVVVGSGPNGLAAAMVLSGAGLSVHVVEAKDTLGGGARSAELTLPGFLHDVCSAVHPSVMVSPFFGAFDLEAHGVEMLQPEIPYAQPLDGGRAAVAHRDLDRTAEGLGRDGRAWQALMRPLVEGWREIGDMFLSDFRTFPYARRAASVPVAVAAGLRVLEQGSPLWNLRWKEDAAPALLSGVATHAIAPARSFAPAAAAVYLASLAHSRGWPIPRGGTQAVVDALVAELRRRGVTFTTGQQVRSLGELPRARAVLLDTTPRALLEIAGDLLPPTYRRLLERFRYGSGVCKVDYALSGPVPWANAELARAGTLHVGGTREELLHFERAVVRGEHSTPPYVLAVQPDVVDGTRAPDGCATLWTYTHVPHGSTVDMGEAVTAQVERFAPGFRDVVLHRTVSTAVEEEEQHLNYIGGDISGGAVTPWQMLMRPVPAWDPYRTPVPGLYLCSSSTPPGPAVHGMNGLHAARRVLRQRFGIRTEPLDLVRSPAALAA
jgi:phytoene dehydrogenase-like protein